jgi:hypothetical protein
MTDPNGGGVVATPEAIILTENEQLVGINADYEQRYGFHDAENYLYKAPKGLNREIVEKISEFKSEPRWMRDFRLKALDHFLARKQPTWGSPMLAELDYNNIRYFVRASETPSRSWDDVPEDVKRTFDRLGIPEAERLFLSGVGAQYESEVVYHQIHEDLEKQGVIFTDTEEDGPIQAELWQQNAGTYGYEIVDRIEFPVGNTNFSSQVASAKASGADIVLAQIIPPDGVALLKEMKAQNYVPRLVFMEKAGNTGGFVDITDGLAEGVLAANWFAEGMGLDREQEFIDEYSDQAGGVNSDLGTIVYGYSIATLLMDAISSAGTTDAAALNEAIGKTDATFPAGRIAFDDRHAAALPVVQTQWVGTDQILVTTVDGEAANPIVAPVPGLQ